MDAVRAIQWALGIAAAVSLVWVFVTIRRTLDAPVRYGPGQMLGHRHMAFVGLLFPALLGAMMSVRILANPRTAGGYGVCLNNVKQLSTALQLYAEDTDTAYPPASEWRTASAPYIPAQTKTLDQCPSSHALHAYAFNAALGSLPSSTVDDASHTALVFETSIDRPNASGGLAELARELRHGRGRYTLGTCDGTVRLTGPDQWPSVIWTPKGASPSTSGNISTGS